MNGLDTTGFTIGNRCSSINLKLTNFDFFYILSQEVNVFNLKFTSYRCTLINHGITCYLCLVKVVLSVKVTVKTRRDSSPRRS